MSEDTTVKRKGISKKKRNMIIAIISVIIIAFVFGINHLTSKHLYNGRIAKNIYIEDIDVSNLTKQEALDIVNAKYPIKNLKLSYNNEEYTINAKDVDLSYNTKQVVDEAYNLTREKSYLSNVMTYMRTKLGGHDLGIKVSYDEDKLDKEIGQVSKQINKKYTIMKTTVLFRMIVLVAMVFAGIANTTVKAQGNNFITNEEKVDDLVVSKVIYRLDGSLYRHMKYDFTYDDQKRMSSKEAFKWDASTEKWIPYFKIDYTYSSNEITLVYARWNDSHRAYDASVEKSVYELNDANMPVAYMNYKWNDKWIEESAASWAMNVSTPATNEATLLTASR